MAEESLTPTPRPSGITNWGGARPGAGRPRGSKGRKHSEVEKITTDVSGRTPLTVLAEIAFNDSLEPALRERAAWHAAQFRYAKLASVEVLPERDDRLPAEIEMQMLDNLLVIAASNPRVRAIITDTVASTEVVDGELVDRRDLIGAADGS